MRALHFRCLGSGRAAQTGAGIVYSWTMKRWTGYLAPASKRQDQCPEPDIIDLAQSDLAVTVAKWLSRYEKLANVTMLRCEAIHHRSGKNAPLSVCRLQTNQGDNAMSLGTILLIILVIALLGGFSGLGGGPFYGTGYYGGGGLGLILIVVLILVLLGRL